MVNLNLKDISHFFKSQGLEARIETSSEGLPLEVTRLLVTLGPDSQNRELSLQITTTKQEASENRTFCLLQILFILPFKIPLETLHDVNRLLQIINKTLALPGFFLEEPGDLVYFRSTHLIEKSRVSEQFLDALVGNIIVNYESFAETIEDVAMGKKTLQTIMEESVKIVQEGLG